MAQRFGFNHQLTRMNGASGTSDIEGKAAMGSGERGGSRTSFNTNRKRLIGLGFCHSCLLVCIRGFLAE